MIRLFFTLWPKNLFSHFFGVLVGARLPFGLHTRLRDFFIRLYRVDFSEAEFPLAAYPTLGEFFIRRLKPGSRPLAEGPLISPVDGTLTEGGPLRGNDPELRQIKGRHYRLRELLGPSFQAADFAGGTYATIYLAPHNYHLIHAPVTGRLLRAVHLPGALWPVNTWSVRNVDGLFCANDRMVIEIEAPQGRVLLVAVGATNVGAVRLAFTDEVRGNDRQASQSRTFRPPSPLPLEKGDQVAAFELGSTVILIASGALGERLGRGLEEAGKKLPRPLRFGESLGP